MIVQGLRGKSYQRSLALGLGGIGIATHLYYGYSILFTEQGVQLGVIGISVLFTLVMTTMATVTCLIRHTEPLLAPAYPLAMLSVAISLIFHDSVPPKPNIEQGLVFHILSSIIAYSLITLAFSQAILLWIQNYQLKHRHIHDILSMLPPLETMEHSLFDLVIVGLVMLLVSIGSGFLFVDDIFAQHLAHKTFFTLLATLVFLALIIGRYLWGWRGMIAVRWTLIGFFLLLVGYFGSKIVLEIILHKQA